MERGRRRPDHRADRRRQMVRALPGAARHQPRGPARPAHRHLRAVGLGQVDPDPLRQPARGASARPHHRRRRRADLGLEADRACPARGRHGVPAFQPVPASDRARELHLGADLGAQDAQGRRRGDRHAISRARAHPRAGEEIPGPALRRPAAARRHRAGAVHEPEDHAVRRADLGARSRDDQGGARRHDRARAVGHDHDRA